MKKIMLLTALSMLAGIASAQVIWNDDFNTNNAPNLVYQNVNDAFIGPTRLHKPADETWLSVSAATASYEPWGLDGVMAIKDFNNNLRTTALMLDGTTQLGTAGTETLTLNLKIAEANILYANVDVVIYELGGDGTGITLGMKGDANMVPLGGETVNNLGSVSLSGADINSTVTLDFNYTAGRDLIVAFASKSGTADKTSWLRLDEVSVTAIPEPATMGLFALAGVGILGFRRRFKS